MNVCVCGEYAYFFCIFWYSVYRMDDKFYQNSHSRTGVEFLKTGVVRETEHETWPYIFYSYLYPLPTS